MTVVVVVVAGRHLPGEGAVRHGHRLGRRHHGLHAPLRGKLEARAQRTLRLHSLRREMAPRARAERAARAGLGAPLSRVVAHRVVVARARRGRCAGGGGSEQTPLRGGKGGGGGGGGVALVARLAQRKPRQRERRGRLAQHPAGRRRHPSGAGVRRAVAHVERRRLDALLPSAHPLPRAARRARVGAAAVVRRGGAAAARRGGGGGAAAAAGGDQAPLAAHLAPHLRGMLRLEPRDEPAHDVALQLPLQRADGILLPLGVVGRRRRRLRLASLDVRSGSRMLLLRLLLQRPSAHQPPTQLADLARAALAAGGRRRKRDTPSRVLPGCGAARVAVVVALVASRARRPRATQQTEHRVARERREGEQAARARHGRRGDPRVVPRTRVAVLAALAAATATSNAAQPAQRTPALARRRERPIGGPAVDDPPRGLVLLVVGLEGEARRERGGVLPLGGLVRELDRLLCEHGLHERVALHPHLALEHEVRRVRLGRRLLGVLARLRELLALAAALLSRLAPLPPHGDCPKRQKEEEAGDDHEGDAPVGHERGHRLRRWWRARRRRRCWWLRGRRRRRRGRCGRRGRRRWW